MTTFAIAAERADATGLPTVEGFAVQLQVAPTAAGKAVIAAVFNSLIPGYDWTAEEMGDIRQRWLVYRPGKALKTVPSLAAAWDAVRDLKQPEADVWNTVQAPHPRPEVVWLSSQGHGRS